MEVVALDRSEAEILGVVGVGLVNDPHDRVKSMRMHEIAEQNRKRYTFGESFVEDGGSFEVVVGDVKRLVGKIESRASRESVGLRRLL